MNTAGKSYEELQSIIYRQGQLIDHYENSLCLDRHEKPTDVCNGFPGRPISTIKTGRLVLQRDKLRAACQLLVDSLEGKPVEPEEAIGAIRDALKDTGEL